MDNTTFNFSEALTLAKAGKSVARVAFRDACYIAVQFPSINSMNTLPYLKMVKGPDTFPVDLSCESLFAEDWYEVV